MRVCETNSRQVIALNNYRSEASLSFAVREPVNDFVRDLDEVFRVVVLIRQLGGNVKVDILRRLGLMFEHVRVVTVRSFAYQPQNRAHRTQYFQVDKTFTCITN